MTNCFLHILRFICATVVKECIENILCIKQKKQNKKNVTKVDPVCGCS